MVTLVARPRGAVRVGARFAYTRRMRSLVSGLAVAAAALAAACGSVSTTPDATAVDAAPDVAATCDPACGPHATCAGTTCGCDPGYAGDGQTCADVDECQTGNGGCDVNATCANTDGGRTCACQPGFLGDGVTCRAIWQRVAGFPGITYNAPFEGMSAALGATLYLATDAGIDTSFFRAFDTATNQLSTPLSTDTGDFCQCGYGQIFVGSGASIFMFGNGGTRFDPAGNTWTPLSGYTSPNGRGEAGGAVDPATGRIYAVGGRDASNAYVGSAIAITTSGAVTAEPGAAPFGWRSPSAYVMPGAPVLYAAGGLPDDNNSRHLVRHPLGTATWEVLADAPGDLFPDRGVGHASPTLLFIGTDAGLYLFDTSTSAWRPQPLAVPPGFQRAISAAGSVWAVTSSPADGLEVFKLLATE